MCIYVNVSEFHGAGVTDSGELLCGCWESNLDPLEEQPVFLTPEPFLPALILIFISFF